jgi:hypothetical protein
MPEKAHITKKEASETKTETPITSAEPIKKNDNTLGIVSLVLGVLSLMGPGLLFGIPAIILGAIAIKRNEGDKGLSITGLVTGIISTVVSLFFVGLIIFGVVWGLNHPEANYDDYRENPQREMQFEASRT